eukprot:COSAG01_NODE_12437_length_1739_cov_10.041463_3_plen_73_part_00
MGSEQLRNFGEAEVHNRLQNILGSVYFSQRYMFAHGCRMLSKSVRPCNELGGAEPSAGAGHDNTTVALIRPP